MACVAVYSVKGGVGKSTIATNLAWCAATISRRRTLLWDLDASGGSTYLLGVEPARRNKIADAFTEDLSPEALTSASPVQGLDVLAADASLRALEATLLKLGKRRRLGKLIEQLSTRYRRIVLDCPPVLNEVSAQVMRAADAVIVPMTPSGLSLRALDQIRDDLFRNHRRHPPVLPVLSMLDGRRTMHRTVHEEHPDWPVVPMASIVEQMTTRRAPLGAYAPLSPAQAAFARLWTAIERKLTQAEAG